MSQPTAKDLIAEASEQRKRELYEPVLVRLFQTYDEDESGTLEANEIRQIMVRTNNTPCGYHNRNFNRRNFKALYAARQDHAFAHGTEVV